MATMNISLPDAMKSWVEAQLADGQYSNVSDYMRDLVRKEQKRKDAIAELQALVDEGIASGISDKTPEQIFREVRAAYRNSAN